MDKVRENITNFIDSIQAKYQFKDKKILEIGCGLLDHNKILFGKDNEFIASDVYTTPHTDKIIDITDGYNSIETIGQYSQDLLIVSEVLEHVFDFDSAFDTCYRLLKVGGYLLITIPWEYPEHGEDYWRYSEKTINLLLEKYGFQVIESSNGFDGEKKTNIFRLAQKL